jgi:hypothetical protein
LKLLQELGEERIKNSRRDEFMYDVFDTCKNLHKCHKVPLPSTTIKEKKKRREKSKQKNKEKQIYFSRNDELINQCDSNMPV